MRSGEVQVNSVPTGILEETEEGFRFQYYREYAENRYLHAVSRTLAKRLEPHESPILFPFFAGLLTEGNTMQIQCRVLRLDEHDLFGRLLKTTHEDVIGNVTILEIEEDAS